MFLGLSLVTLLTAPALIEEPNPARPPARALLVIQEPEEGREQVRPFRLQRQGLRGGGESFSVQEDGRQASAGRRMSMERRVGAAERLLDQARQELEAGRPEQARGMIRAARALLGQGPIGAQVRQRAIRRAEVEVKAEEPEAKEAGEPGTIRIEIRTIVRNQDGTVSEQVQVKEMQLGEGGILVKGDDEMDDEREEMDKDDGKDDDQAKGHDDHENAEKNEHADHHEGDHHAVAAPAGEPEPEPALTTERPVGVGFLLEMEDGGYVVRRILPDSPAAREGSIKVDDRLLGIIDAEGKTLMFQDRPLDEIIPTIRGEAGSKVTLIVQTGKDDPRQVELERQPLTPPVEADDEDRENNDDPETDG